MRPDGEALKIWRYVPNSIPADAATKEFRHCDAHTSEYLGSIFSLSCNVYTTSDQPAELQSDSASEDRLSILEKRSRIFSYHLLG